MDPASTSLRAIRSLVGKADDAPRAIRAYHGSPHSFSRFDASKIGTGEGAQAYGHGLYFAGNEEVARGYRNALRWRDWDTANPAKRAAMWIETRGGRDEALEALQDAIDKSYFGRNSLDATLNQQAIDYLRSGGGTPPPPPSHMYEVEIGYPEHALLDLDGTLMPAGYPIAEAGWGANVVKGSHLWNAAAKDLGPAGAAMHFRFAGIPGIRYLDQDSSAAGQGTHNYVMFPGTEDRIKILRKYGLLPPLMAPALMGDE